MWFRNDLRLHDNPALAEAVRTGSPVIPVFIWPAAPAENPGIRQQQWLIQSLKQLDQQLEERGSRLVLLRGNAEQALTNLCGATGARMVFFNRCYDPESLVLESSLTCHLLSQSLDMISFPGNVLHEPGSVKNKSGSHFRVFTPFWNHCMTRLDISAPKPVPITIPSPIQWPASFPLEQLENEVGISRLHSIWQPGESGAKKILDQFVNGKVVEYGVARERPDQPGTSRLSPHLHFGEISVRQILYAVQDNALHGMNENGSESFLRQLYWREFAHHLLYHEPHTLTQPLRNKFSHFPWQDDDIALARWQEGTTGYPYIDAAMRELKNTGWMHNRARMAVASFLVKDLLIPWQQGAEWFWENLLDADLANNTFGWQWVAGCGADAAPFFRIFNPVKQGERFDPDGAYVRRWVPELSRIPNKFIHCPWKAPATVLENAGVSLGQTYARPIVDHALARDKALSAYRRIQQLCPTLTSK
jgi:deoxyribodipyrimidine photo-lyase